MTHILIALFIANSGGGWSGGASSFSQEFTSKERCEAARENLREGANKINILYLKCEPK
jgi:hypothetical protein